MSNSTYCRVCHPGRDPKYWASTPCYTDECLRRINNEAADVIKRITGTGKPHVGFGWWAEIASNLEIGGFRIVRNRNEGTALYKAMSKIGKLSTITKHSGGGYKVERVK